MAPNKLLDCSKVKLILNHISCYRRFSIVSNHDLVLVENVASFLRRGLRKSMVPQVHRGVCEHFFKSFVIECICYLHLKQKALKWMENQKKWSLFCTLGLLHSIPCFFCDSSFLPDTDRASIVPRDDLLWFLQFPTFSNVGKACNQRSPRLYRLYRVKMDQKRKPIGLAWLDVVSWFDGILLRHRRSRRWKI